MADVNDRVGVSRDRVGSNKTTAELVTDLTQEMSTLIHQEMELAKRELTEKGKRAGIGAGMFGAAGLIAFLALGCLTATIIAALQLAISVWLAALLVGVAYLLVAGSLFVFGRTQVRRATPPLPKQAVESTKEDVAWLRTQAKSGSK